MAASFLICAGVGGKRRREDKRDGGKRLRTSAAALSRPLHDLDASTGLDCTKIGRDKQALLRNSLVSPRMFAAGLHDIFGTSQYGLHIYYNIPALVGKTPLSPAGNPWADPLLKLRRL
jgi:hypothetical protein